MRGARDEIVAGAFKCIDEGGAAKYSAWFLESAPLTVQSKHQNEIQKFQKKFQKIKKCETYFFE